MGYIMKKFLPYIILAVVCIGIIIFPVKTADEIFRIEFTGNENGVLEGTDCTLYYSTLSPDAFNDDQSISCPVDNEKYYVEFRLDGKLNNNIKGLRIDFPAEDQLFSVGGVFVKSAGVLKKRYDPCVFFSEENLKQANDIQGISPIRDGKVVYIRTGNEDPYIVFSDALVDDVSGHFSHYIITKLLICAVIIVCFFSYKKDIFGLYKNGRNKEGNNDMTEGGEA